MQTVYDHPWDSKNVGLVQRGLLYCSKFAINFGKPGIRLVVEDKWSLIRGGRYHKFDCIHFTLLFHLQI
jgi:hypothetical protein